MLQEARKYQAFYTKSTPIVDYMVQQLSLKPDDKILEPCGGDGVFVESIVEENEYAHIDIYELNEKSIKTLNEKFLYLPNVKIKHSDTLLDEELIFSSSFGGIYDKIIANPPYGAWQEYEKRDLLKKLFPNIYAKETYGLFLYRCVELLKDKGLLTFIIPDTYLNLHMHKALRKHILQKTKIKELALFPSSFFQGVNFGYANLSIITLEKCLRQKECLNNNFRIINGFRNVEQLSNINSETDLNTKTYLQKDIYANPDHAFLISDNFEIINAINNSKLKVGDIASCVTGFYSGNDKTFLQVSSHDLKNGKNYCLVNQNSINRDYQNIPNILEGIEGEKHFLPIVKGGNVKYLKSDGWFMNWSKEAVKHYKTNKKSRFQNPQFYFKFGIGVPMVSSSSITASLIENKLFDQSIVGVFPKDESLTYYLLAFFNSPTCNKFIRTINPSANNPANYIKKIPFIIPEKSILDLITKKTIKIIDSIRQSRSYNESYETEIWRLIENIYKI
ncbi:MAG TPA: Eco57I restriction-modification methylase domain-containing protein [Salinivirgaceae bacterium]|nr:Eco57I restriction-modification methylase domain-containing protein [Salinivirgaceae bacterium]HQA75735.1 Eco57I restriction-modification methylase domain-containing protein [Salinivirgaceae bacterium]